MSLMRKFFRYFKFQNKKDFYLSECLLPHLSKYANDSMGGRELARWFTENKLFRRTVKERTQGSILEVLKNRVCKGNCIWNKFRYKSVDGSVKVVECDPSEWTVEKNARVPIVVRKVLEEVQEKLKSRDKYRIRSRDSKGNGNFPKSCP